jgi:hypothetical protein
VLEVRVPASKVTAYFPPGTPLRLMSEAEYRDLLGRARKGSRALDADASPNLVRARHEVRWDGGRLLGRSEFTVCYEGPVPSVRPLEPWSPAVLSESRESAVRTLADGRTALWIEETGETKDILRWSVAARSGSRDRVFDLSLPTVSVSRLVLDLPRGLKPEITHAAFESSHPSPDEPDRVIWSFDGAGGDLALQLRPSGRDRSGPSAVSAWIGGPTRIEVLDASASFEADWIANLAPGGPRTLGFELDPGLKFVSLEGPDVVSVRSEPDGGPPACSWTWPSRWASPPD